MRTIPIPPAATGVNRRNGISGKVPFIVILPFKNLFLFLSIDIFIITKKLLSAKYTISKMACFCAFSCCFQKRAENSHAQYFVACLFGCFRFPDQTILNQIG